MQGNYLPINWQRLQVQDIISPIKSSLVSGPFGSNIGKRFFVEEGIPLIRGNNLTLGVKKFIDEGFVYITEEKAYELRNCKAIPGDIIFTAAGTLGQVGIIPQNSNYPKYIISNKQLRLRCDTDIALPEYLYYWFSSSKIREYIINQNTGASVPLITLGILRSLPVNLPPLPTQRKIAAILSVYDDLIENNTRRIAILEEMAQSLYREWFVHFRFPEHEKKRLVESELGLIPEGWEVVRFTDIADVLSGGTPKTTTSEYWNGPIPFFTPKDAPSAFYVTQTEKSITHIGLRACNSKLYPRSTVFITARGTVGKVVLSAVDMAMNQSCYALQGRDGIDQFTIFLSISDCIDQLKQNAHGAVFDTIIVDTFRMLHIVKPPLALTNTFKSLVLPIFEMALNLLNKNTNLRKTRDLLLPKLISGEVDVEGLDIHI